MPPPDAAEFASNSMSGMLIHKTIGKFQQKVGLESGDSDEFEAFDWMVLIEIFAQLLPKLLENCQNRSGRRLKRMNILDRGRLHNALRREILETSQERPGIRTLRSKIKELKDCCIETCSEASEQDLDAMIMEVTS